jgi:hypothetical protein
MHCEARELSAQLLTLPTVSHLPFAAMSCGMGTRTRPSRAGGAWEHSFELVPMKKKMSQSLANQTKNK